MQIFFSCTSNTFMYDFPGVKIPFFPYYTPLFAAETKMKSDKNYKKKQKTLAKHYALIV